MKVKQSLALLKRYLRLLKQDCHQHAVRSISILRTPYRRLVLHDALNYASCLQIPEVNVVSEVGKWQILEIGEIRFFWPCEYSLRGIKGLYQDTFAPAICNPHAFEIGGVRINHDDWVVDAGACEGFFTHYALQRGANVLMIEPVPKLAEALSRTFEQEIRTGRVRLLKGCIGANIGETQLTIPPAGPIAASSDSDWGVDVNWQKQPAEDLQGTGVTVKTYTLDGIIENGIVPTIDFLKMDIENAEVDAIRGASELLRSKTPKLSIAVYHDFYNAQIIRSLVLRAQPKYRVKWRGVFVRESFGPPRPYMLYGAV